MAENEASNPQPYMPAGRYSHVAATIDSMLYVWGGWRKDTPQVHSGAEKTAITSTVDVLDLEVTPRFYTKWASTILIHFEKINVRRDNYGV